jgi:predicted membrane chloride channel (bestrophin family)
VGYIVSGLGVVSSRAPFVDNLLYMFCLYFPINFVRDIYILDALIIFVINYF